MDIGIFTSLRFVNYFVESFRLRFWNARMDFPKVVLIVVVLILTCARIQLGSAAGELCDPVSGRLVDPTTGNLLRKTSENHPNPHCPKRVDSHWVELVQFLNVI